MYGMPFGGGLGSFFGYGGFQQPAQNPFDPRAFAKELGLSQEDRDRFVSDYEAGNLNELFGSPMSGQNSLFDQSAPIEDRVGLLEDTVEKSMKPRQSQMLAGMMPSYGMGTMPYANYGMVQPRRMFF